MPARRWLVMLVGLAAVVVVGFAVFDPFATVPNGEPGEDALPCEEVLEGGRYPDIPVVEAELLEDCRPELRTVLGTLDAGGPFVYDEDDDIFFNREGYLPGAETGEYRSYTVDTPDLEHRGTRRVITLGDRERSADEWEERFYTDDHYDTFWRIEE